MRARVSVRLIETLTSQLQFKSIIERMFPFPHHSYDYYQLGYPYLFSPNHFHNHIPYFFSSFPGSGLQMETYQSMLHPNLTGSSLIPPAYVSSGNNEPKNNELVQVTEKVKFQENKRVEIIKIKKERPQEIVRNSSSAAEAISNERKIENKAILSRFVKKNTESNIINQILSFLWTPYKSKNYLRGILNSDEKINAFYSVMGNIKTKLKSHFNRFYVKELLNTNEWPPNFRKICERIIEKAAISEDQIALAIRKLIFVYLREICQYCIVTSKKMNKQLWILHLEKCRQIKEFLFNET